MIINQDATNSIGFMESMAELKGRATSMPYDAKEVLTHLYEAGNA